MGCDVMVEAEIRDRGRRGWGVGQREIQRIYASGLEDGGRGHESHYRWTVEIGKVGEQILL